MLTTNLPSPPPTLASFQMLSSLPPPPPSPRKLLHLLSNSKSIDQTKQIHAQIIKNQNLSLDPTLLASLIRTYSFQTHLHLAHRALSLHPYPPTFAYNLLIRAYVVDGGSSPMNAVVLFDQMLLSNLRPDKFTVTFVVGALSSVSDCVNGRVVHGYAIKVGLDNGLHFQNTIMKFYFSCGRVECGRKMFDKMRVRSIVSWTALVSGLVECGELEEARRVFERMLVRNVVSWTAMINGCARNGRLDEAFELFWRMMEENIKPNEYTLVSLLIACTELGSLSLGRWVHEFTRKNGALDRRVYVGTSLIDMYSKCGSLKDAIQVFNRMPIRSIATWNSMITSLGVHGYGKKAISLFKEMEQKNVKPDEITLAGVLCACVREEMVEEGVMIFKDMRTKYGIEPVIEHHKCLVELMDCKEADMIKDLIMELDVWDQRSLIKLCRENGNLKLEEIVSSCTSSSICEEVECYQWEVG